MIRVTRLNGREFVVNAEMIQYLEETPDTVLTFVSKDKIVVQEPAEEIIRRVVAYQRSIRTFKTP